MTLVYREDQPGASWVASKRFVAQAAIPAVGDLVEVHGHNFRVRERQWASDFQAIRVQLTSTDETRDIGQVNRRDAFKRSGWRVLVLPQDH